MRKNQIADARFNHESATKPGLFNNTVASPSNIASEKAP
ncbi:Uncharacterised protein [Vibrio cholerae]|nr:Uncharacterised protein [Vibrio cholerae]